MYGCAMWGMFSPLATHTHTCEQACQARRASSTATPRRSPPPPPPPHRQLVAAPPACLHRAPTAQLHLSCRPRSCRSRSPRLYHAAPAWRTALAAPAWQSGARHGAWRTALADPLEGYSSQALQLRIGRSAREGYSPLAQDAGALERATALKHKNS
jgi:hypothetical protein